MAAKIKKGDNVIVLAGEDRGVVGQVLRVFPKLERVLVKGVNVVSRHLKSRGKVKGSIVSKESTIHVSNVGIVDPGSGRPSRVGFKIVDSGTKVRYLKTSGKSIDD